MTCARCGRETAGDAPRCAADATLASLPPSPSRGGRRIMLAAAATVLMLAGVATVVAFGQASGQRSATVGQVLAHPGDLRATSDATQAAAGAAASVRPSVRPAVGTASRAGARRRAAADTFLGSYFMAINDHDYRAYLHLFGPASRRALSAAGFQAGYGTTHDSAERLTELRATAAGQLAATVTFTSHQAPASSPARVNCLRWNITLYLVPRGGRYVIGNPPADYYAKDQPC